MAFAWDLDLDDQDDDPEYGWYSGLLSAGPFDPLPETILERLEESRPSWHAHAACRGRTDVSWLDPDHAAPAASICLSCPVRGPCADAGEKETWGVWGGRPRGWRPRAA